MEHFLKMLILILLVSCGKTVTKKEGSKLNIHPLAQAYVASFEARAQRPITSLEITFREFDPGQTTLGYCQKGGKSPLIVINLNFWNKPWFSEADKEQLIFHELGHCILNREHLNDTDSGGNPLSIMNYYHFSNLQYENDYSSYIQELFGTRTELAGILFDGTQYASVFPEFIEPQVEVKREHELSDCVHEVTPEETVLEEEVSP